MKKFELKISILAVAVMCVAAVGSVVYPHADTSGQADVQIATKESTSEQADIQVERKEYTAEDAQYSGYEILDETQQDAVITVTKYEFK